MYLKQLPHFLQPEKIDISSLKSEINVNNRTMSASILFALTKAVSIDDIENDFLQLCEQISVQGCIKKVSSNLLHP